MNKLKIGPLYILTLNALVRPGDCTGMYVGLLCIAEIEMCKHATAQMCAVITSASCKHLIICTYICACMCVRSVCMCV